MTKDEALALLDTAPVSAEPSAVNPSFTQAQSVLIVLKAVTDGPDVLIPLMEKRVWQVVKNQRRPRY